MSGNVIGKCVLSILVLGWALLNLFPVNDTPFDVFIAKQPTAHKGDFAEILQHAQARVGNDEDPSLYLALLNLGKSEKIDYTRFFPDINLADIKNLDKRNEILLRHLLNESQGKIKLGLDLKGGVAFTLKIDDASLLDLTTFEKEQQLNKAIDIVERRVNGLGVAEPRIRARGTDSIEVQLPGVSTQENPDILQSLQKPAKLTFHKVHSTLNPTTTSASEAPIGYKVVNLEESDSRTGEVFESPLFIKKVPEMGGSMVKAAFASTNQYGGYEIDLNMTDDGARRFEEVTRNLAADHGRLAIVLDNEIYSAPRVNAAIPGGRARISGHFTQREAFELANVLNNPLEFELKLEEMNEIGPTLAEDAKHASINAALLGAALVILFMIAYYFSAGFIAVIAVTLNIIIVLGTLASIKATLTLPGVAALVLTIGIAVDSNILIFERIREELQLGKKLKDALLTGYDKAFTTIVDANITTLLTAFILIWLGTGPVKGFGVTLSIGIGATLFCALIVSRVLLEILVNSGFIKQLLPFNLFKEKKIDYLKFRKPAFLCSWLIVLGGVIALIAHRDHIYGIDFVGGDEVSVKFAQKLSIQELDKVTSAQNLGEVIPVYQSTIGNKDVNEILKIQTEQGQGHAVFDALNEAFPQAQLEIIGETSIGAALSDSIKTNALLAIAVALLGILLYVAFRFELGYGIGAVVSTLHDVLMTLGIFVILGGQFSAAMVAAILMIVGYSINDTIVVFDRIREELILNPTVKLKEIVNHAINKTLSRTLLTSLTTLMAAASLYIFGAGVINDLALVFIIGIITGTFSSIFIASPIFYWWHKGDRGHVETRELMPKYEWDAGSQKK